MSCYQIKNIYLHNICWLYCLLWMFHNATLSGRLSRCACSLNVTWRAIDNLHLSGSPLWSPSETGRAETTTGPFPCIELGLNSSVHTPVWISVVSNIGQEHTTIVWLFVKCFKRINKFWDNSLHSIYLRI